MFRHSVILLGLSLLKIVLGGPLPAAQASDSPHVGSQATPNQGPPRTATALLRRIARGRPLPAGLSPEAIGKRELNRKPATTRRLIADQTFGPLYREVLRLAHWNVSPAGKAQRERAAALINRQEATLTARLQRQFEGQIKPGELLERTAARRLRPVSSRAQLSDRALKALMQGITTADSDLARHHAGLLSAIDPVTLFDQAARSQPDAVAGGYLPEYAPLLMRNFRLSGTPFVDYCCLANLITTELEWKPGELQKRLQKAVAAGAATIGGTVRFQQLNDQLRHAGYGGQSTHPVAELFISLATGPLSERVFSRILTRAEIDREIGEILAEQFRRLGETSPLRRQAVRYLRKMIDVFYQTYYPDPAEPVTASALLAHQQQVLTGYARDLIQASAQAHNGAITRRTTVSRPAPATTSPQPAKPGTRLERIAAYRKAQKQQKINDVQTAARAAASSPEPTPTHVPPSPAAPTFDFAEIERRVIDHAIDSAAAEDLLGLRAGLSQMGLAAEIESLDLAVAELLDPAHRRLHGHQHGQISKVRGQRFYELRTGGDRLLRVYFVVGGPEGLLILAAHEKKDDKDQRQKMALARKRLADYERALRD